MNVAQLGSSKRAPDKTRNSVSFENVELFARSLIHDEANQPKLKEFLNQVPWHAIRSRFTPVRSIIEQSSQGRTKPPAYLVFGTYIHGGVVGITRVTLKSPWLTRVLARLIHLTDPHHKFTSAGVACNSMSSPHRDQYNSPKTPNLVIPIGIPRAGGEVWVARTSDQEPQATQTAECNGKKIDGYLLPIEAP